MHGQPWPNISVKKQSFLLGTLLVTGENTMLKACHVSPSVWEILM